MRKLELGLMALALFAASQGACKGGSMKGDGSTGGDGATGGGVSTRGDVSTSVDGPLIPDGPAIDVAHPGDFVTGDADGTTFRAERMPQAGLQGLADGMIWMTAGTTSTTRGWTVYIPNSVGTHACVGQTWIMLLDTASGR